MLSTGCRLVIWDVNQEGLNAVAKEIKTAGGEVHSYKCNLRDKAEIHETATRVKEDVGEVSLLVNNAGIVSGKKFMDCTDEEISATFDVNSLAHFWVSLFTSISEQFVILQMLWLTFTLGLNLFSFFKVGWGWGMVMCDKHVSLKSP